MTVSTALKKINFIDTFCYKYCYYGEEGYLFANVLKGGIRTLDDFCDVIYVIMLH